MHPPHAPRHSSSMFLTKIYRDTRVWGIFNSISPPPNPIIAISIGTRYTHLKILFKIYTVYLLYRLLEKSYCVRQQLLNSSFWTIFDKGVKMHVSDYVAIIIHVFYLLIFCWLSHKIVMINSEREIPISSYYNVIIFILEIYKYWFLYSYNSFLASTKEH